MKTFKKFTLLKFQKKPIFDFKNRLKKVEEKTNDSSEIQVMLKDINVNYHKVLYQQIDNHLKINKDFPCEVELNKLLAKRTLSELNFINEDQQVHNKNTNLNQEIEFKDSSINKDLIYLLRTNSNLNDIFISFESKFNQKLNFFKVDSIKSNLEELELKTLSSIETLSHVYFSFLKILITHKEITNSKNFNFGIITKEVLNKYMNLIKTKYNEIDSFDTFQEILTMSHFLLTKETLSEYIKLLISKINVEAEIRNKKQKLFCLYFLSYYFHQNKTDLNLLTELNLNDLKQNEKPKDIEICNTIIKYWLYLSTMSTKIIKEGKGAESFKFPSFNVIEFEKTIYDFINSFNKIKKLSNTSYFNDLISLYLTELNYIFGIYLHHNKEYASCIKHLSSIADNTNYDKISQLAEIFLFVSINNKIEDKENKIGKNIVITTGNEKQKRVLDCLAEAYDYESSYRNSFNSAYRALKLESKNENKYLLRDDQALKYYTSLYFSKHIKYSYLFNKGFKTNYTFEEYGLLVYILNHVFNKKKDYLLAETILEKVLLIENKMNFLSNEEKIKLYFTAGRIFTFSNDFNKAVDYYSRIRLIKEATEEDLSICNLVLGELSLKVSLESYLTNIFNLAKEVLIKRTFDSTYKNVLEKLNSLSLITKSEVMKKRIDEIVNKNI